MNKVDLNQAVYGKMFPQAVDVEKAVLGSVLLIPDTFDTVSGMLGVDSFYLEAHKMIFASMKHVKEVGRPLDTHTVIEQLRKNLELDTVGGPYYVNGLTVHVTNTANIETHCQIVLQKAIARKIITVCADLMNEAYEDVGDPFELLDRAQMTFSQVDEMLHFGDMVDVTKVLVDTFQQIEKWRHNDSPITGVRTGYSEMDRSTRGWQPGDLIILAARPSVGKTAVMLNFVTNAAESFLNEFLELVQKLTKEEKSTEGLKKKTVAVFSLEMQNVRLMLRMLAAKSRIVLHKLQTGRMDEKDMNELLQKGGALMARLGIKFDDRPGLTVQKLRSKCRKMLKRDNLGLVVIDYLQLMQGDKKAGNREQQVSQISRELKNLAAELNVPIIALSQLSREVEKRNGEPMLSDLRESGSLEQDADVVMFLFKPSDAQIAEDKSLINRRYIKIAKQRDGILNKIHMDFRGDIQLLEEPTLGEEEIVRQKGPGAWRPVQHAIDFTESNKEKEEPF